MGTVTRKPWTADELCRLPRGWRYEIDEGALVIMSPAGRRHGRLVVKIASVLNAYAEAHAGEVDGGEFGIYLRREAPQTLRAADVAFYGRERVQQLGEEEGFPDVPPDLVVEVHLPDEEDMGRKVRQYLAAGVLSVWVVDPRRRTLTQYPADGQPRELADSEAVVEDAALPGFVCRLQDLFGEPRPGP